MAILWACHVALLDGELDGELPCKYGVPDTIEDTLGSSPARGTRFISCSMAASCLLLQAVDLLCPAVKKEKLDSSKNLEDHSVLAPLNDLLTLVWRMLLWVDFVVLKFADQECLMSFLRSQSRK